MSAALLVAESPWWTPKENSGEASSLPFFQGIQKLLDTEEAPGQFRVYSANFYDSSSFKKAIEHLTHTKESRQILHVGGHGDGKSVGGAKIRKLCEIIPENGRKIKGLILSSCWGGEGDSISEAATWGLDRNCNITFGPNWVMAYRHAVLWFESALLESSIIHNFAHAYINGPVNSKKDILEIFHAALNPFDPYARFGTDDEPLHDTLRVWVRGQGGQFPKELTKKELFDLDDEDEFEDIDFED
jgi:hypothetical protein